MDNVDKNILEILEQDARTKPDEIAKLTGISGEEIQEKIKRFEQAGIIRKYKTIVDWDVAGEDYVYAIIELKVTLQRRQGYQVIAERLYKFDEVRSVRLISGDHDISLTVRGKSMKQVAFFVAEKIATLENIQSTSTHFVLKTYKEDGVILSETEQVKRLPITP
ncbi:Lrp/AsnC family transcriptional regulator [Methanosalsum natronophilum]|uniref:Lrp/AsnC family transcriptional regulator n=1 Tax=Methanosalsum natronophilum TaxID=768733 RepID=UPI002169A1E4|nr:Lrp/AsnC family transcriptional regulator [Methanosalsum natronophilum]MCS3923321.1 DNA-binding Lrp family transcriptional regulator [Methanosalsum natronophilum]